MNELTTFQFEEDREIRTLERNGDPWFVAKDVAEALGYSDASNPARLFAHVPDEWRGVNPIHTLGGVQEMLCISEQGLYFFLGRSDKDTALPFQKWIAGDVLPSIRKKGYYAAPQFQEKFEKMEAMLNTLMERQALPMGANEIKARSQKLQEERERELRENNTMRLPWHKPVTQFVCPFYSRSDVTTELNELHDILKKVGLAASELHRFVLKWEEHNAEAEKNA